MTESPFDASRVSHLLPENAVGKVLSVTPIHFGLSGAGVYAVTSDRGEYVLRVQSALASDMRWTQQLAVLRRAAAGGIAPPLLHVDETARATVSVRIRGGQFAQALGDPSQRDRAIRSLIAQLRATHGLDPSGVQELDGVDYARDVWNKQRERLGFPAWARDLAPALDGIERLLREDQRRVVAHNDVNPGNVLWDGSKTWLIDWEVASLSHPYYDVATLTMFLNLDVEQSMKLLTLQEQRALGERDRMMLMALRRLTAIAVGCTMIGLVTDIADVPASREDAPTLADIYGAMRAGTFDLQSAAGQSR